MSQISSWEKKPWLEVRASVFERRSKQLSGTHDGSAERIQKCRIDFHSTEHFSCTRPSSTLSAGSPICPKSHHLCSEQRWTTSIYPDDIPAYKLKQRHHLVSSIIFQQQQPSRNKRRLCKSEAENAKRHQRPFHGQFRRHASSQQFIEFEADKLATSTTKSAFLLLSLFCSVDSCHSRFRYPTRNVFQHPRRDPHLAASSTYYKRPITHCWGGDHQESSVSEVSLSSCHATTIALGLSRTGGSWGLNLLASQFERRRIFLYHIVLQCQEQESFRRSRRRKLVSLFEFDLKLLTGRMTPELPMERSLMSLGVFGFFAQAPLVAGRLLLLEDDADQVVTLLKLVGRDIVWVDGSGPTLFRTEVMRFGALDGGSRTERRTSGAGAGKVFRMEIDSAFLDSFCAAVLSMGAQLLGLTAFENGADLPARLLLPAR
eukprot:284817343_3